MRGGLENTSRKVKLGAPKIFPRHQKSALPRRGRRVGLEIADRPLDPAQNVLQGGPHLKNAGVMA
jgi:type II secretory pathway predicted ATPase ExeA